MASDFEKNKMAYALLGFGIFSYMSAEDANEKMRADWKKARWEAPKRLGAFAKADLKPGKSQRVDLAVDPRLLATYEAANNNWHIRAGEYRLLLGQSSDELPQSVSVTLPDSVWSASVSR